ncbi:hypothetical protein [Paraburkholderia sp. RL17-337-BIB-A]|uniref:hypothetical protein n=1 Tax=Paraburkholderia sp. RL17-337-BIB-A TaxID=3031636 RepID=UPI0038B9AD57
MNDTPALSAEFSRLAFRFESVFHVDAMLDDGRLPADIRKAFTDDFDSVMLALRRDFLEGQADQPADAEQLRQKIEAFIEDENGELGWLVKARQREFVVVGNGEVHYSWAPVRTAWFHAPSYEAAQRAALEWAEQYSREVWGETEDDEA